MPMVAPARRPTGPSRFGVVRVERSGAKRPHNGVDLYAPAGTPVTAPAPGVVTHAHTEYAEGFGGYGRVVVLRLDSGGELLVGHLERVTVERGQRVRQGAQLGTVGTTKFTRDDPQARFADSEPHVHVEWLRGHRYPARKTDPRADPTALAFYRAPARPVPTELFATVQDIQDRADALLDRWNALQAQAIGPGAGARPDIPRSLQDGIISDRRRFRKWITRPTFGLWGALTPRGLSQSADYAHLERWNARYNRRAGQLRAKLPAGESLAKRAEPVTLPRQTTLVENLETVATTGRAVGYGLAALGAVAVAVVVVNSLTGRR